MLANSLLLSCSYFLLCSGEDNQVESSEDNSSRLSFMNENSGACLSDVLGNISDSTFKQFAEMKDIFDEVDFSDVFSHLKDVIRTPEKLKQQEENIQLEDHPPVSDVCYLHIYQNHIQMGRLKCVTPKEAHSPAKIVENETPVHIH